MAPMSKGKWREEKSIPDVQFQQAVYKELFLSIETEKYFCLKSQAGGQRRLVVSWGTSRGSPCKTQQFQRSPSSTRCATSTEKCLPRPGEMAAAALPCCCGCSTSPMPNTSQPLPLTPPPAGPKSTGNFLPYRFVLQLLQEVLSWMPCYFQDLGQLIQVWQAVLKITL